MGEHAAEPVYLAVWSGPRNISTALMRSFGNRPDTWVCDEPLYPHYLLEHGLDHPGREEILAHHEADLERVIARLTGEIPEGRRIFYQKHMAHHLLPEMPRAWIARLSNCFLIREPREMLTSLLAVLPAARLEATGLPQQHELFEQLRAETGSTPPVLDARDVLENPRRLLALLCRAVGIPFDESMLAWPPGRRPTDGIWAKHWYANVERSTGFAPYRSKPDSVPADRRSLLEACQIHYEALLRYRLK